MLHRTSRQPLLSKNLTFQAMSTGWVYPLAVVDLPYYISPKKVKNWKSYVVYMIYTGFLLKCCRQSAFRRLETIALNSRI